LSLIPINESNDIALCPSKKDLRSVKDVSNKQLRSDGSVCSYEHILQIKDTFEECRMYVRSV